jgi:hypothetical protein
LPVGSAIDRRDFSVFMLGIFLGVIITILIGLGIINIKNNLNKNTKHIELKNKRKK